MIGRVLRSDWDFKVWIIRGEVTEVGRPGEITDASGKGERERHVGGVLWLADT